MASQYRPQYQQRQAQPSHSRRTQGNSSLMPPDEPGLLPWKILGTRYHGAENIYTFSFKYRTIYTDLSTRAGPQTSNPEAARQENERRLRQAEERKAREMEADRRKASRPTDKTIPEGVDQLIVGDGVQQYKKLREVERRLDNIMMRKRLDMQDHMACAMASGNLCQTKKMKIWISNTVENQPWQGGTMEESAFDFNMGVEASYKVKIEGHLIEEEEDEKEDDSEEEEDKGRNGNAIEQDREKASKSPKQPPVPTKKTKMSHFFKGITVDFDRNRHLQPEGMTQVEWKKPAIPPNAPTLPPAADFDSLEFERKSDENINCTINFYRDEQPERYLLSKPLSELLDTEEDDRTSVLMGIWEYIKAMGLQQDEEKRQIQCDDRLRAVRLLFPQYSSVSTDHVPSRSSNATPSTSLTSPRC